MDNSIKPPMNEQSNTGGFVPVTTTAADPVPVKKDAPTLQCVVCHNVDTPDGPLNRLNYPGYCGHCGGAFRIIK